MSVLYVGYISPHCRVLVTVETRALLRRVSQWCDVLSSVAGMAVGSLVFFTLMLFSSGPLAVTLALAGLALAAAGEFRFLNAVYRLRTAARSGGRRWNPRAV